MLAAVRQVRAGAMAMVALLVALLVAPLGVGATVTVHDTELNSTVGVFDSREGVFRVKLPAAGLVGWLAVGSPVNGCSPLKPAPTWPLSLLDTFLSSLHQALPAAHQDQWVVLLKRGDCNFVDKLMAAANAGYSAVIVYNNEEDGIVVMKDSSNAPIPAVMVDLADGIKMARLVTQTANNKRYSVLLRGDDMPSFYDYLIWIVVLLVFCLTIFACFMCCCCLSRYRRVRSSRLPLPALSALPVKQFDAEQHAFDTCAICLDDFKQNDEIRVLPCNHAYHPVCIDPWLTNSSRLCPICKRRVLEDEFSSASSDDDDRRRSSASSSALAAQRRRRRLHTAASSERDHLLASTDQRSRHQHHQQQQQQQQSAASYGGAATSRNPLEDVNTPSGSSSRFVSRFCRCLRRSDLSQHAVSSAPATGNPPSSPTGSGRATATAAAAAAAAAVSSHTASAAVAAQHSQRSEGRSEATSLPSGGSGVIARLHRRRVGGHRRVPVVAVPTEQPPPPAAAAAAAAAEESDESGEYSRGLTVEVDCDSDTRPLVV